MRGFAGIILLFGIIIAAGILLMSAMQEKQEYSFKELLPEMKTKTASYAITLQQMSEKCDWTENPVNITTCIQNKADLLFNQYAFENTQKTINCSKTIVTYDAPKYKLALICHAQANSGENSINIDSNKEITITAP